MARFEIKARRIQTERIFVEADNAFKAEDIAWSRDDWEVIDSKTVEIELNALEPKKEETSNE
jgi:hypothetical protein